MARFLENAGQIWLGWLLALVFAIWVEPRWIGIGALLILLVVCIKHDDSRH